MSVRWNWRKTLRFGVLRINLSKSGVGYSVGVAGYRWGTNAKGNKYQQVSVPGTGIFRRDFGTRSASVRRRQAPKCWFPDPHLYVLSVVFLGALWVIIKLLS